MKFFSHVFVVVERVRKLSLSLNSLAPVSGGYSCRSLRILYKGTVQSVLLYVCEFWGNHAIRTRSLRTSLLSFQRKALITVNKAYRTMSYDANCVIPGIITY